MSAAPRVPYAVRSDQTPPPVNVVGEAVTIFAADDKDKPFEVHVQRGRAGGGPPPHHHPWDEAFYVLEGEVELRLGDEVHALPAGSFVHIPANTTHAYTNLSETATLLGIVSDSKAGAFFTASDAEVKKMPDDAAKLIEVGRRFGIVFE